MEKRQERPAKKQTANMNFRVELSLRDEFLDVVHQQDRTSSQLIRDFMRGYIKRHGPEKEGE